MKSIISLVNIVASTLVLMTSVNVAWGGGPHDFTDGEGNEAWFTGKVSCIACHTPVGGVHPGPLWDPEYDATILPVFNTDMLEENDGTPYGPTKLCLCCHDGTITNDMSLVFGGPQGGNHPVGIVYDDYMTTMDPRLKSPRGTGLPLYDERLECTTCHDPHSDKPSMLRMSTLDSELCFRCHDL
jgi:predicted CXXCH cytochrome family protein